MKKEEKEEEIRLSKGSQYRLTSIGNRESNIITTGIFVGFTTIASDEGICVEMDKSHDDLKGKVRVIPTHMLLAIDLLEQKKPKDPKAREAERTAHYFG